MAKSPTRKPVGSGKDDVVTKFIAALELNPSPPRTIFGMVKPADTAEGLMFAHAGDCRTWIYIPATTIRNISAASPVRCRGHAHHAAFIELHEPASPLERTLSDMVDLHAARFDQLAAVSAAGDPRCGQGQHWGQDQYGNWGCQPG